MTDSLTREQVVARVDEMCDDWIALELPHYPQSIIDTDAALRARLVIVEEYLTKTHGIEHNLQTSLDEIDALSVQLAQVTEKYEELKRQHDKGS